MTLSGPELTGLTPTRSKFIQPRETRKKSYQEQKIENREAERRHPPEQGSIGQSAPVLAPLTPQYYNEKSDYPVRSII